MALDPAALLTQVETAIEALLTGGHSTYSIADRTVTKLDLAQLFNERRLLQAEVARTTGSGSMRLGKMMKPGT